MVVFERLNKVQIEEITKLQLNLLKDILSEQKINIEISSKVVSWIVKKGFDPIYGARPIKRAIQKSIKDSIAQYILENQESSISNLFIDLSDNKIKIINDQNIKAA